MGEVMKLLMQSADFKASVEQELRATGELCNFTE
jgi:hypothetical protein